MILCEGWFDKKSMVGAGRGKKDATCSSGRLIKEAAGTYFPGVSPFLGT